MSEERRRVVTRSDAAEVLGVEMSESEAGEWCSVTMPEGTEAKPGDVVIGKAKRRE